MTASDTNRSQDPTLETVRDILGRRGWLAERDEGFRTALLECGRMVGFETGEPLYRVGDTPNGLFGLLSGVVQIQIPGEHGEMIATHRAASGFWIGDLALFAEQTRLVSVVARGPVRALFVPRTSLRRMVRDKPEYLRDFYALSHENMQTALRLLANLSVTRSPSRIALRLLHIVESANRPEDWIDLAQEELAEHTAVSLPTVQRCLRRFSELGVIEIGYGRLRVLDREQLFDLADS